MKHYPKDPVWNTDDPIRCACGETFATYAAWKAHGCPWRSDIPDDVRCSGCGAVVCQCLKGAA